MIQEVTIPEYFSEARASQKNLDERRYTLAKDHLLSTGMLSSSSLRKFILDYAEEFNCSITEALSKFALKRLNAIIEDDLMEYAAELGVNTLKAIREDEVEKLEDQECFNMFGYYAQPAITNVDELTGLTDLYIVPLVDKPYTIPKINNNSNPFLTTGKFSQSDYDKMAEDHAKTADKSWDALTEAEWQKAKDEDEAAKIADANQKAYKLLQEAHDSTIASLKLRKKKSEADYPSWVTQCT